MKEILHHQKDGSEPINTGMIITYQLVQDILFHQQYHWLVVYLPLWKKLTSSVGSMKFPTGWKLILSRSKPPIKFCTIDYYRLLTIIINQLCYYNHVPNHPPNHVVSAHPVALPLVAGSNLPPCSLWPRGIRWDLCQRHLLKQFQGLGTALFDWLTLGYRSIFSFLKLWCNLRIRIGFAQIGI